MKISYMLKREDFYKINQETLDGYYSDSQKETKLYIYPELNAIITKKPSKLVKQYLYTEYNVTSSTIKKFLVTVYTRVLLNTLGIFSTKSCIVKSKLSDNFLIYPCNKKYRLFNFEKNEVTVIPKKGFPDGDIKKEISFRTKNIAEFIPEIKSFGDNYYTEAIIDGYPLARAEYNFQQKKDELKKIWKNYIKGSIRSMVVKDYAKTLHDKYSILLQETNVKMKKINFEKLGYLEKLLQKELDQDIEIQIGISHGDLQSGNVWVENNTGKIYIIDWEAYSIRSTWYDDCTLDENLRMETGLQAISKSNDLKHNVVLLEDMIFRLEELNNLPYDYNSVEFNKYIETVLKGKENV